MKKESRGAVTKKRTKRTKGTDEAWHLRWCRDHAEELALLAGCWITVHPDHGIIVQDAMSMLHLIGKGRFLKRSIFKHCANIDVSAVMRQLFPFSNPDLEAYNQLPDLSPPADLFDNNVLIDGSNGGYVDGKRPWEKFKEAIADAKVQLDEVTEEAGSEKLCDFAKRKGLKGTDVLIACIDLGMTGINVNTALSPDAVAKLELVFAVKSKSPWPSPHKQPKYVPSRGSWRDRRYD